MDNKTSYTKKGGKKPHAHLLPMMALVLFGMIALVGVAAADSVYHGAPPATTLSGTVNGDVDVQMSLDPWNPDATVTYNQNEQNVWGNFTLKEAPTDVDIDFARLYVVVYGGSMSANYTGNMTVKLYNGDTLVGTLVDYQPLNLVYNNASAIYNTPAYNTSVVSPLVTLSRVTSDYIAVFDIKNIISNLNDENLNVSVTTWNSTGKFDGRVKTVQLAYGWNVSDAGSDVDYWVNEGHDPMTKYGGDGYSTFNETWFNSTDIDPNNDDYEATLWIDYLNNVAQGDGVYKWRGISFTPTVLYNGKYAGLNRYIWSNQDPGMNDNNKLEYARGPNDWYKINFAVLAIKS